MNFSATYCIPSLIYSVTPIYGPFSYILFFLQPFASFCVSCTIWQVFAITLERYLAVSSPLEQRTRKAKFGVGWICVAITFCAFILNLLPVPFENELVRVLLICFKREIMIMISWNLRLHFIVAGGLLWDQFWQQWIANVQESYHDETVLWR